MTDIHIERRHQLGLEKARAQVEGIADLLRDELQADCQWSGNKLVFKRPGASGTIDVGSDQIEIDIELGMVLAFLKGAIEERINRRLDLALG